MAPTPMKTRRRKLLIGLGAVATVAGSVVLLRKPLMRLGFATFADNSAYDKASVSFLDSDTCVLTARAVEGPFFVPDSPLRSDLRDGQAGQALRLQLKFVDAANCRALAGAAIHIWHANALGIYSGYGSHSPDQVELTPGHVPVESGERFLRGHQVTDAQGRVDFQTIFPAWYSFRTPHIHVQAQIDPKTALTTQLYFPDELNTLLRETLQPYRSRPEPLVSNRSDPVIHSSRGAPGGWLKVQASPGGHVGSVTIGVKVS